MGRHKSDIHRIAQKVAAIVQRLADIHEHRANLIGMLDESKLDAMILALGIGRVELDEQP